MKYNLSPVRCCCGSKCPISKENKGLSLLVLIYFASVGEQTQAALKIVIDYIYVLSYE